MIKTKSESNPKTKSKPTLKRKAQELPRFYTGVQTSSSTTNRFFVEDDDDELFDELYQLSPPSAWCIENEFESDYE